MPKPVQKLANKLFKKLRGFYACPEGLKWLRERCISSEEDLQTAWNECPRGDWLLWLLGELHWKARGSSLSGPVTMVTRALTLAAAECAALQCAALQNNRMACTLETDPATVFEECADVSTDPADSCIDRSGSQFLDAETSDTFKDSECADIIRRYFPQAPIGALFYNEPLL